MNLKKNQQSTSSDYWLFVARNLQHLNILVAVLLGYCSSFDIGCCSSFDCSLEFVFSLLLLQPFSFSPVSFACNFQDWGCVILREIDFLLKICWSIPCLHPLWKVPTWIKICASLNHRKKTKADGSRLIPRKHTETLVLLSVSLPQWHYVLTKLLATVRRAIATRSSSALSRFLTLAILTRQQWGSLVQPAADICPKNCEHWADIELISAGVVIPGWLYFFLVAGRMNNAVPTKRHLRRLLHHQWVSCYEKETNCWRGPKRHGTVTWNMAETGL